MGAVVFIENQVLLAISYRQVMEGDMNGDDVTRIPQPTM